MHADDYYMIFVSKKHMIEWRQNAAVGDPCEVERTHHKKNSARKGWVIEFEGNKNGMKWKVSLYMSNLVGTHTHTHTQ